MLILLLMFAILLYLAFETHEMKHGWKRNLFVLFLIAMFTLWLWLSIINIRVVIYEINKNGLLSCLVHFKWKIK